MTTFYTNPPKYALYRAENETAVNATRDRVNGELYARHLSDLNHFRRFGSWPAHCVSYATANGLLNSTGMSFVEALDVVKGMIEDAEQSRLETEALDSITK